MRTDRTASWMRRTGLVLVTLALAALSNLALSTNASAQDDQVGQVDQQLVQQGNALWQENCARCHGANGLGVISDEAAAGPAIINVGAASVDFMIASGRMPAESQFDPLTRRSPAFDDTQRAALVAYVTQLQIPDSMTPAEVKWISHDTAEHHINQRPREMPVRTAVGVSSLTLLAVIFVAGSNDVVASVLGVGLQTLTTWFRVLCVVLPAIAWVATIRLMRHLQAESVGGTASATDDFAQAAS